MKINTWLQAATSTLGKHGIATSRLDSLVMLQDVTNKDKSWLLAHGESELSKPQLLTLTRWIQRRSAHEPLAYIRGKTEFYGREFEVSNHTLEPRPESETMIDLLKQISENGSALQIIDIGTGSGCLAVTAKLEIPKAEVYATDIDDKCIKIARRNAHTLSANARFLLGDLLQPIPSSIFHLPTAILANLPYVPDKYKLNQAATHEPRQAIFGGPDGLDIYARLFEQLKALPENPLYIFTESLPSQHEELAKVAMASGFKPVKADDFIQLFTAR